MWTRIDEQRGAPRGQQTVRVHHWSRDGADSMPLRPLRIRADVSRLRCCELSEASNTAVRNSVHYCLAQADWQASKAFLQSSRLLKPGTPPSTGADKQPCIAF